jgi:hypothetical protein
MRHGQWLKNFENRNCIVFLVGVWYKWSAQKRVNIAGLTSVLWKALSQGWPLIVVWVLGFHEGSHHPLNWWMCLTVPELCKQYGLSSTAASLLGVWNSGARQRVFIWQPLMKNSSRIWVYNTMLWLATASKNCQNSLLGELAMLCDSSGRGSWQACAWFP